MAHGQHRGQVRSPTERRAVDRGGGCGGRDGGARGAVSAARERLTDSGFSASMTALVASLVPVCGLVDSDARQSGGHGGPGNEDGTGRQAGRQASRRQKMGTKAKAESGERFCTDADAVGESRNRDPSPSPTPRAASSCCVPLLACSASAAKLSLIQGHLIPVPSQAAQTCQPQAAIPTCAPSMRRGGRGHACTVHCTLCRQWQAPQSGVGLSSCGGATGAAFLAVEGSRPGVPGPPLLSAEPGCASPRSVFIVARCISAYAVPSAKHLEKCCRVQRVSLRL